MFKKLSQFFHIGTSPETLDSFEIIYREHCDYIRTVIYWLVRSQDVDDLVQETFIKAWRSYSSFKGNSSPKTWLYRIARNVVVDYYRKEGKKENIESFDEVQLSGAELKDLISKALLKLNLKHREVFILYYKFGHSIKEISQLLSINEGTVKSRLSHGREVVKKFLLENGVHDE